MDPGASDAVPWIMQHPSFLRLLLGLLLIGAPATGAAQEQDVARGSYPFFQRTLTIAINAKVPGELQIMRSRAARVDVAALASPGVATFALGGYRGDELRLTAAGAEHAVFIVTVPERVYVSVRAPGTSRSFGAFMPVETVAWGEEVRRPPPPTAAPVLPGRDGYFHIYGAALAPSTVILPSLAGIRRLDVRVDGNAFSLAATRPLSVSPGAGDPLVIDIAGDPADLVLTVPAGSRAFQIDAGGQSVLVIRDGRIVRHCSPAVVQSLEAGPRIMLTPRAGRLECGGP